MSWLKIIIPLSITLGPHLVLLSLFELSSRLPSEHIEIEPTRTAQFSTIPIIQENSVQTEIEPVPEDSNQILEPKQDHIQAPPSAPSNPEQDLLAPTHKSPSRTTAERRKCNHSPFVSRRSGASYLLDQDRFTHLLQAHKEAAKLATLSWSTTRAGIIKGVRIKRIPCSSPLRAMGLTPGMLITHINGQLITSNADLYKAYRSIKRSSSFSLKAKKQGQIVQRTYTISQF